VAVKVDGTDDEAPQFKAMQKKYGVVGLPTVLLIDKTGKEAARFNEFVPPEKFAAALKKVN
jgi:thiol:disulfide interchange protein DsbD